MWYNYDGLGKRRNKLFADPDDLHWYRWAGWSVLSEYDTAGASGWEIPAAAARVDVAGLAERGAGAAYAYRLHDHLGSVRGLRGASKAPLARYAYAPYGELNYGAGRPLRRGFTGHHWDAESGMYYAPFRYYVPGAGRWLSRDPLGFVDGPNVYGYVRSNPINYADPTGLFAFCGLLEVPTLLVIGAGLTTAVAWILTPQDTKEDLFQNLGALGGALAEMARGDRRRAAERLTKPTFMRGAPRPDPHFSGDNGGGNWGPWWPVPIGLAGLAEMAAYWHGLAQGIRNNWSNPGSKPLWVIQNTIQNATTADRVFRPAHSACW